MISLFARVDYLDRFVITSIRISSVGKDTKEQRLLFGNHFLPRDFEAEVGENNNRYFKK